MDNHIVLTSLQMLDILFRFATAGTLSLMFIFVATNGNVAQKQANLSMIICLASYILLTAPIENDHYGWLRPPLLLLTNCTCYALLAVYWHRVHGQSIFNVLPVWARAIGVGWFIWLSYFFLIGAGIGVFHTIHDGLGLLILLLIVIDAIRDFDDDLVQSRRDVRKLAISFITVYSLFLTTIEVFFRHIKDDSIFSVANALLMLLVTWWFSFRSLQHTLMQRTSPQQTNNLQASSATSPLPTEPPSPDPSPQPTGGADPTITRLEALMADGIYSQNGLTIARLADAMNLPEHQLRVVINQQLGFDNFSQFLNSYRIPAICNKLAMAEHQNTPILTLALETGYNSIAPFNRVFKEYKGMTPTQYRKEMTAHFQN